MPRVLVIDNYDSFTWNLVQEMGQLGAEIDVVRNDAATVDEILARDIDGLVISPGPGRPEDAGITCELIAAAAGKFPLLGVCLGHQAIGAVYGAEIVRAPSIMHGKTSDVHHRDLGIFKGLPNPVTTTRYHSLVIDPATLPDVLEVTAEVDNIIMGVRHREFDVEGVQFHPESVLTRDGLAMLQNFLDRL